jgi:serine/threonine protein kinase
LRNEKHANRSYDIWAMGCILFEMMTGETPFAGPEFLSNIESDTRTKPLPTNYSQDLRDLVNKLLTRGKENAPTID